MKVMRKINWVKEYGYAYQVNLLNKKNNAFYETLTDLEKDWLNKTIILLGKNFKTTDALQTALYNVVKDDMLYDKELKKIKKDIFKFYIICY